jgi:hypothetical protein
MNRSRKMIAALLAGLTMIPAVAVTGIGTAEAAYRRVVAGPRGAAVVGPRGAAVVGRRGGVVVGRPGYAYRPAYGYGYRRGWYPGGAAAAGLVGGLAVGALAAGAYGYGYGYPAYGGSCVSNQPVYDSWGNFLGYRRVFVPC